MREVIWDLGVIRLDVTVVLVLLIVVALDLGFRWLAFQQIESVGVDVTIFGAVFSGTEALYGRNEAEVQSFRVILGVILVVLATITHRFASQAQGDLLDDLGEDLTERDGSAHLQHIVEVGEKSLLVTLSPSKAGKRRRRKSLMRALRENASKEEVVKYLKGYGDSGDILLLLPNGTRRNYRAILGLLGFLAVMVPITVIVG